MKMTLCVVVFCAFSSIAHAQDSGPSVHQVTGRNIFSADRLAAEVSRVQGSGSASAQREPTFTKEKLSRPTVIAGLGLMAVGAMLAATAGESATMTTFNPITQQPITSTISVTNNGRRWVGIGMLGGGAALTFLGLAE
jgi:hypothetical protein